MNHEYAIWLAERPGCSAGLRMKLLEHFGTAQAVWESTERELMEIPGLRQRPRESLMEKGLEQAKLILRDCARLDIRVISMEDTDYPAPLRDLEDAPIVLYVRGTMPDWENTIAVGIVGTRRATSYGLNASRWLAANLAHAGCTIVSGMALGIDGRANLGALEADGTTVAVLGCGADVCYPPAHKDLMARIVEHGAVITEYPPGTEPRAQHFPMRNRIMSGLCRGVIVIEAPEKSGALITADRALEQGRDVFAVPGNINSPQSAGTNRLLREGGAELITCAADVLSHYPEESRHLTPTKALPDLSRRRKERPAPTPPSRITLSAAEQTVLDAVKSGADSTDAIIEETGMMASRVLAALTMLEINGMLRRDGARVLLNPES